MFMSEANPVVGDRGVPNGVRAPAAGFT